MGHDVEDQIATVARRQHGVVTRAQLLGLGLRTGAVRRRTTSGRLHRLHRGVYLVGPIMPARAREMAAALACGPGGVVSHLSAASLWV
jgi:predicted transcriptional regulator of viral defense system